MDRIVTIASLTRVLLSCVVGVLLGCISVVFTTVRDSSTPDSKEKKQADAGSLLSSKIFSLRRVVVELFISRAWRSIHTCATGMFSKTLYAQHPVSQRIFPSLPGSRLHYYFLSRCKFSPLEHTFVQYRFYAQNPVFEIAHQESVKVYDTSNCEKPVYSCSIFNYLRAVVCNLYRSIFSTGPVPQWY